MEDPYRTMVWLARFTGVRVSELLAFRRNSIDWNKQCIWVREAVHDGVVESPKSHRKCYAIQLTAQAMKRLRSFCDRNPNANEDDWLFPHTRGSAPFRAVNVLHRAIAPAVKKLGITHVTWHVLRHWHATVLHEEGVPVKVAQLRLGHSRAETTMKHYVHTTEEADMDAAKIVYRRMCGRKSCGSPNSVSRNVSRKRAA